MIDVKKIADQAKMIVNGYAFTMDNGVIRIINLYRPERAAVLSSDGKVIETDMDDIELSILYSYYERNKKYMEEIAHA